MPYLLLEASRVSSFVEEIPMPSDCVTSEVENPDFPLGVWKIQKAGGSRLIESGAGMRECHGRRWNMCHPAREQIRTQLHPSFKTPWSEVKVSELCPVLCNAMDYTVHGILQARILECIAFPFSRGSSQPGDEIQVSCIIGRFFYQLSHKVSPRILEWVAYPFSSGSSWPRNQTGVSCIEGGFFTNWAISEALKSHSKVDFKNKQIKKYAGKAESKFC